MSAPIQIENSEFPKDRHIRYWLRCLKTFLPREYTSNDSNRMTLAFFIISALDLLGALETRTTASERQSWIDWIYHCQHPDGGFRGSPASILGPLASEENARWDRASLPNSYFALATLLALGDDLKRVRRRKCLTWLARLQRKDGSFSTELVEDEETCDEAGGHMRFCYGAAGLRWILRAYRQPEGVEDIDVDALVGYINASESYDHGFAEAPYLEAHAGLSYCAIGALAFVDRLPDSMRSDSERSAGNERSPLVTGISSLQGTLHWLVSRQRIEDDEAEDGDDDTGYRAAPGQVYQAHEFQYWSHEIRLEHHHTQEADHQQGSLLQRLPPQAIRQEPDLYPLIAGFNGRCNKTTDTCYSFWVGGSLSILNHLHLISTSANRRFLLERTQHPVSGGFGKFPGDLPDILHSYLGLAALALMQSSDTENAELKTLDPMLCISREARRRLEALDWWNSGDDS